MQIRFKKILEREFKYNNHENIRRSDIFKILIDSTGLSRKYIDENPDELLQGEALLDFNKSLKSLKQKY